MTETSKNKIFVVAVLAFIALCLFFYLVRGIIAPFLIAAFLTYLLSPLVTKIQSYGYRRWVGVAIIAFIFLAVIAAALIIFIPLILDEINKFSVNAQSYYDYVSDWFSRTVLNLENAVPIIKEYNISGLVAEKIKDISIAVVQGIPQYLMNAVSFFSFFILVPVITLFMLLGGDKTIDVIVELVPAKAAETTLAVLYEINFVLGGFIRGQLIEALFVGVASTLVLSILGVNYALLIGVTAGVANFVPYVGPTVGILFAAIVGLIQFQSATILLKIVPAFLVIQFIDANLINPVAVGQNVNLGPVTMIFVILAGGLLFGFIGVIFAVPVAAIIRTVFIMLIKKYKNAI